ncbi:MULTISPECIES: hypothetical protein [unclassified Agarivorans]|uniref:hypothetical protein n=1 Tax=unclassified Agarivorans TaxID=2636026 RepID=UPI0026E2A3FC|nr:MULTISPECIES: hypothetical protein [unclassified Agarivorans]MDO6684082.1 hypothetical protein [Agarivorans sp. 3_MG-2023]MDO6714184.1 hypothetical protein [Agarivorans sp. 2_MG-2023]
MLQVKIPQNLSLRNALNFCNRLWDLEHSDEYAFDFANLGLVEPFTMAYVANELKRFRKTKPESKFTALNHKNKSYAAHMGFFRAFGLKFGNEPGEAAGSSTYLPLTILNVADLQQEAADSYDHVGNIIEAKSEQIAKILTRQNNGDLVDTLTFSIREILRNVVEHSESEIIEYCAQYWPSKSLVELAILDTGNGIMHGLSTNPFLNISDERDALHLAMLPGVSGKMYKGVKKRKHDEWQNSGFGLYMTSRICRNGGDFFIASNDKSIFLDRTSKNDLECKYKGTALRLRIDTSKICSYSEMLAQYRNEGYEAAKKFSGKDAIEPSIASTMLARDFQET